MPTRPAFSDAFAPDALPSVAGVWPLDDISPEWAWGDSRGEGVKVAVIDSGIEASHPAIGGAVESYVAIVDGPDGPEHDTAPHEDSLGHGTACAGIIRSVAPAARLFSVKVLHGRRSSGAVFSAGLRWAIENSMQVCNLSLGTTKKDFYAVLHELADDAYFRNVILVTAANNMPIPSYPSMYASVISVGAHAVQEPGVFYYNPNPPVEFGALGIDVRVAWRDGGWLNATGNSFAAPHITGMVARILAKHPGLTMFQVKMILRALAANLARD